MAIKNSTILFTASGIVLEGKKKGNGLGFPTANIPCDNSIPAGIYAGEVVWKGIAYPTAIYKGDAKNTVEAHLLDFSDNLYGEKITIIAEQKIRESRFFSDREELIAAIAKDIQDIKKIIADVK